MLEDRALLRAIGSTVDEAPWLVALLDGDGRYIDLRGAWLEILGWLPHDLIGKRPTDIVHPDDLEALSRTLTEAYVSRSARRLEVRTRCKDGTYRRIAWYGAGMQIDGVLLGVGIDVSAEREARLAEQRVREQLRSVLTAVPDYITQVDRQGTILYINRTYPGTSVEQVVGTNVLNWIEATSRSAFEDALRRIFAGSVAERVVVVGAGESGPTWYQSRLSPVIDNGVVVGATIVGSDVTQERRGELEYRRNQRLETLGLLSAGIAHDFNNLVTAVQFAAEAVVAASASGDAAAVEQLVEDIRASTRRCASLTQHLLSFSKGEASEDTIELSSEIRAAQPLLRRLLGRDVTLTVEALGEDLWVPLSSVELQQILANLASNSRRVLGDGGHVRCVVRCGAASDPILRNRKQPAAVLTFEDDGPGMDWATQSRIFEPFFTSGEHLGTGIGLATVYGVVQRAGGDAALRSAVGQGTCFTFYFPGSHAHATRREATAAPAEPTLGSSETVLLVDDERVIRSVAARYLARIGYTVLAATDAEDAENVARAHPGKIDLLVSDLRMPGRDGFALAKSLKERYPTLAVLFITGYCSPADEELLAGRALLLKPFALALLSTTVRAVLDARRPAAADQR